MLAVATLALAALGQCALGLWAVAPFAWGAALLLFALQLRDRETRQLPPHETPSNPRLEWTLAAGVLAVAVFFRIYRLDLIPSGLNHDVAWNGLYGLRILGGEPYTPYTAEAWGRETTMLYLQALGIRLLGVEVPAMIYPAVIAGIALLPLFYLWLRELFGPRLALAASFLLAVSGWHLVFSRIGWRAVLQPLVSTLAYWLFVRAWRRRRPLDFSLAGMAVGAAIYTYNAARLLPALFPLFGAYVLALATDRRGVLQRWRRGALDMAVCFGAVVFPMAYFAANHWWHWQQRASAMYLFGGRSLWENVAAIPAVYLWSANGDDFFVTTPVLEWPVAVLFVFGFLWCLANPRDRRAAFLLLGWLVAAIPGMVTVPNANRLIGTLPFAYAFAGLGALFFVRQLAAIGDSEAVDTPTVGRAGPARRVAAATVAALLAIAAAASTWTEYFGPNRRELPGFYPDATIVGRYARTLLPDFEVRIGGKNFPRETLDYLTYQGGDPRRRSYTWIDDVRQLGGGEIAAAGDKGVALILATEGRSGLVLEQLRRRYPGAGAVDLRDWTKGDEVFARALLLSPAVLAAPAPVAAEVALPEVFLRDATRGSAPGQFLDPRGIAVAADGTVFVADAGNHRVQVFDADGRLIALWGEKGASPGTFDEPSDIAIDADGKVLVVDAWNNRVQKLEPDGFPLAYFETPEGMFGPRGIGLSADRIYVADTGGHAIAIFDRDGLFAGTIGRGEGSEPGQLRSPLDVAVTEDGRVWVVDSGNHRLQVFEANGDLLREMPVPGWSGSDLREGYLAALGNDVLLSDPLGGVWRVSSDGRFTEIARGLRLPGGIAVAAGKVLVGERAAARVTSVPLP